MITCKVVVLPNKAIAFLTSSLPSPSSSSLLKLPMILAKVEDTPAIHKGKGKLRGVKRTGKCFPNFVVGAQTRFHDLRIHIQCIVSNGRNAP